MKDIFKQVLRDGKERLQYLKYKSTLSKNPKHDDIYIVEFPKSGITWLSFLLSYIELSIANKDDQLTFYNHHKFIADINHIRGSSINSHFERTYIKSHSTYNPYYYFVIYLIRNPFDVMVSYYNFMSDHGYQKDFEDFVNDSEYGIKKWVKHVKSWHYKEIKAQRIHFLRYEDMMRAPKELLLDLYANIGFSVSKDVIDMAIEKSSVDCMSKSEEHYSRYNKNYSLSFVGGENKRKIEDVMTDNIKHYINVIARDEIEAFYPDINDYLYTKTARQI